LDSGRFIYQILPSLSVTELFSETIEETVIENTDVIENAHAQEQQHRNHPQQRIFL